MNNRNKNNHPSFSRMLMLFAVIFGAFVGLFEMYSSRSHSLSLANRISNQNTYLKNGLQFLQTHLSQLNINDFDSSSFYQINPDNNTFKHLDETFESKKLFTSFIINSRASGYDLKYISACIPMGNAISLKGISFGKLIKTDLWPFITELNGEYKVHCCPKDQPTCQSNNVIDEDSRYIVQILKYDPNLNHLKPVLGKSEFGSVSSAGFFVFGNKHYGNKIHGRFFTFFNECLSQKIIFGKSSKNCSQKVSFKTLELTQSFQNKHFNHLSLASSAP